MNKGTYVQELAATLTVSFFNGEVATSLLSLEPSLRELAVNNAAKLAVAMALAVKNELSEQGLLK